MAAGVIRGRVLDADGRPVAGSRVMVVASPVPVPDVAQVTGADGAFALSAPVEGTYRIAVHTVGRGEAVERSVEVSTASRRPEGLEIVLPEMT